MMKKVISLAFGLLIGLAVFPLFVKYLTQREIRNIKMVLFLTGNWRVMTV